ncbi:hypothetical protein TruAng_005100 [Truncatella angustata]|nr:hypothetical protein TruAng_005100 [Truncatella angustata]
MPGTTNGTGAQQTPIPVPVPPVLQTQSQSQQVNYVPPTPATASGPTGAAVSSVPLLSKAPVASVAPIPSNTQTPPTPAPPQAQTISRPVAVPAAQTPIPAPVPHVSLSPPAAPTPATPAAPRGAIAASPAPVTGLDTTNAKPNAPPRKSSPERPKVEPLTPPLGPVQFPPPRQSHAYPGHPEQQTAIAPPAPEPIDFGNNPDVLALQSAISILQLQSAKSKRDMVVLQKAKEAALADPEAFVKDLGAGKVHMGGTGLAASLGEDDDDDEDSSEDEAENATGAVKSEPGATAVDTKPKLKPRREKPESKPWSQLPNKQNVVRMPPINWSQYAVVGESLDRLHREQVSRPSQGTPATISADGMFVFQGAGRQEENRGIAAPYDPLRDKLPVKKPKTRTPSRQQG